jgi:RimJ/RimL family protein N-acetyltransferase
MHHTYPLLNVQVRTPRLTLVGATDDLLERLVPIIRDGILDPGQMPFDDPMSLYEDSPQREWKWLRGIWAGRARADPQWWRFYFVIMADGSPVGMQDLIGTNFAALGTVATFSWLRPSFRQRGFGTEMRSAILHLAFAGLAAREAVPAAAGFGVLTFGQLCVVGVVQTAGAIAFGAASGAHLKALVSPDRRMAANSRLETTSWIAQTAGPPLGGLLISVAGATVTMAVDAVHLCSSWTACAFLQRHAVRRTGHDDLGAPGGLHAAGSRPEPPRLRPGPGSSLPGRGGVLSAGPVSDPPVRAEAGPAGLGPAAGPVDAADPAGRRRARRTG